MATGAGAETPVLTVYAGDYFTSEWGPGPIIEEGFEAFCECDLQWSTGDLLPRLLLEGERTKADVVIGLTSDVTARARATELFTTHGQDNSALTLPIEWTDDTFLPFNYGHTAFIYNETTMDAPPASFDALLDMPDEVKIVIQDPRTSISGRALVLWVQSVYGDKSGEVWEEAKRLREQHGEDALKRRDVKNQWAEAEQRISKHLMDRKPTGQSVVIFTDLDDYLTVDLPVPFGPTTTLSLLLLFVILLCVCIIYD